MQSKMCLYGIALKFPPPCLPLPASPIPTYSPPLPTAPTLPTPPPKGYSTWSIILWKHLKRLLSKHNKVRSNLNTHYSDSVNPTIVWTFLMKLPPHATHACLVLSISTLIPGQTSLVLRVTHYYSGYIPGYEYCEWGDLARQTSQDTWQDKQQDW